MKTIDKDTVKILVKHCHRTEDELLKCQFWGCFDYSNRADIDEYKRLRNGIESKTFSVFVGVATYLFSNPGIIIETKED